MFIDTNELDILQTENFPVKNPTNLPVGSTKEYVYPTSAQQESQLSNLQLNLRGSWEVFVLLGCYSDFGCVVCYPYLRN